MKGKNRIKPKVGKSQHKSRDRKKYVGQWERTIKNKERRMARQKARCKKNERPEKYGPCRCSTKPRSVAGF